MNYSNVKKEFSTFSVEIWTAGELRKEVKKMTELKEYYQEQLDYTDTENKNYFYDLWEFYADRKRELEIVLEKYEQKMIKVI